MIRDTSMLAFIGINDSGVASTQRGLIYLAIKTGAGMTRQEICRTTGLAINAVCGRVNELVNGGAVIESERRKCRITGRLAHPVQIAGQM